ncbi:MAG: hypothetical protein GWN82_07640, partial [Gemmatimonadetes bacterium]|nr:hypothetical protein [Gemmatimonadota bacterium]NIU30585.1 hypothetical protein [Gemmatimonadota bacterium]NIV60951.1 hypothetical protein [Gemmatimonadota bacterium]NIW63652.1 hypothetical protein [Gemmatimonadota bacterium]NIX38993.1 hypothetical protein [Gemmatimonadota bacterium]
LVVSPYASILAWPVDPGAVARNMDVMRTEGGLGEYGLYEAIDFGVPGNGGSPERGRIVRSYMAHHQGMILLALNNLIHDDVMVERFHADPRMAAAEFLLHERA